MRHSFDFHFALSRHFKHSYVFVVTELKKLLAYSLLGSRYFKFTQLF